MGGEGHPVSEVRGPRPWIATVIPTWREAEHIERCLRSVIAQTWPADRHLVHIVDGGSDDGTLEAVEALIEASAAEGGPEIKLIQNPDRHVAAARNLSLDALPDEIEYVFELIGHAWLPPDHLERRMQDLEQLEGELGGPVAVIGTVVRKSDLKIGMFGRWVEATLTSPLGNGGGQFEQFSGRQRTTTPPFSIYRRATLDHIGGWNERFPTSQDSELNSRLSRAGEEVWRSDASFLRMAKREDLLGWLRFSHRYGFWRSKLLKQDPQRAVYREFLPWAGLLSTTLLLIFGFWWAWLMPAAYIVAIVAAGIHNSARHRDVTMIIGVPFTLFLLHSLFSIGLVDGLCRSGGLSNDRA